MKTEPLTKRHSGNALGKSNGFSLRANGLPHIYIEPVRVDFVPVLQPEALRGE